jgi:2,3-diphosphopglycerate-independent phosphoglycerate mutase
MGTGLAMAAGDIAFKCNFACVEASPDGGGSLIVTARRADRAFEADGPALCASLDGLAIPAFPDLAIRVRYATEHRAGVVLSVRSAGPSWLSDAVSGTDPLRDGRPLLACVPTASSASDDNALGDPARTADAVNAVCAAFRAVLAGHPVNAARAARGARPATALLLRGCGVRLDAPPLSGDGPDAAWSASAVLAPTRIIRGLGASVGAALLDAPGGTGDYGTALGSKADAAAAWLLERAAEQEQEEAEKDSDASTTRRRPAFLLLHVKAVDDAGHDRDPALKAAWLGAVDAMVARLAGRLASGGNGRGHSFVLAATGDHSTPALFGDHSVEPVPFAASTVGAVVRAVGGRLVEAACAGPARIEPVPLQSHQQRWSPPSTFPPPPAFDETAAAAGCLGRFPGREVMPLLARLAGAWGGC